MPVEVLSTIKKIPFAPDWGVFLLVVIMGGCSADPAGNLDPLASKSALYGPPLGIPSKSIPRVGSSEKVEAWTRAPFSCVQTELSPATLYHSSGKYLAFFTHLADYGMGAPSFAAFNTPTGPKITRNGEPMDANWMEENWVLVWFTGAKGWTNWDSPWVVYLQHKPITIKLNEEGLHFEFKETAGDVVLFPLYGYEKASPMGRDFLAMHGLPSNKIRTWEWVRAIPREPLMRVKYWASATREFPVYCEDSFSVNRAKDTVTIRQRFRWHSIVDDWETRHIKLAPISPPLALASMDKQFPVKFSKPVMDFAMFTTYGPYMGVEDVDSFDATFKVLQYVNETEAYDPPQTTNYPTALAALERLGQTAKETFRQPERRENDHAGGESPSAITSALWLSKGLPYYDAATRTNAFLTLQKFARELLLSTNRVELDDPGKVSADILESLWAYAHFSGDWDFLKERWGLVKQLFSAPNRTRWVGFGCDSITRLGEEAAPCLAMARMAYMVGDLDNYNYACYMFAREVVHLYVKQRGASYFQHHQPWHSMEFMGEEVYVTQLRSGPAGWQIDGPKYPWDKQNDERNYHHRWIHFQNEDVARFYRDYLKEDVHRELDLLRERWESKPKYANNPRLIPSEAQLRSLLLNETPAQLAEIAAPDQFSWSASEVIANCISVLRTSHPTRYERLIPGGDPSPFVAGLEREVTGPNPYLIEALQRSTEKTNQLIWPEVTWWKSWTTPTGHSWTLGHVTPIREGLPSIGRTVPLSWNTEAVLYSLP